MTVSRLISYLQNGLLVAVCLIVMVNCGGFEANNHPDDEFRYGRGLYTVDEFGNYVFSQSSDPRFRRARVTTQSSPLKLKTKPEADAPAPSSGPSSLPKNSEIDVFWPWDIVNNHAKIYLDGQELWVTYESDSGEAYLTLLEDIYMPQAHITGSGLIAHPNSPPYFGRYPGPLPQVSRPTATSSSTTKTADTFLPSEMRQVSLSPSAISDAYEAIRFVQLNPVSVKSCTFEPLIGNNDSTPSCYKQVIITSEFRDFVARHGHRCAESAAKKAFGQTPGRILFQTAAGGQVTKDRMVGGGSSRSTHATGQAFDLFAVRLFFSNGSRLVPMLNTAVDGSSAEEKENYTYYWEFTQCWRTSVRTYAKCPCVDAKVGAMTYRDNSAHHNHLHMSLPMCERSRYNVSCI